MIRLFLVFLIHIAVVPNPSDARSNSSVETHALSDLVSTDSQGTTERTFTKSLNNAKTPTSVSDKSDFTTSTINQLETINPTIKLLSDLSEASSSTPYQESTGPTLPSTTGLTLSPRESFLQKYKISRQRFLCPVSVCDPYTFNNTLSDYSSFSLEFSCCSDCSCDYLCEKRENCCPDMIQNLFEPGRYPTGGIMSCHQNSLKALPVFDGMWSGFFISKCVLTFTNKVITDACEEEPMDRLERIRPVSDSKIEEAYKNKYCAICNYVKEKNILYWDLKLACEVSSFIPGNLSTIIAQVRAERACNILYIPPAPRKKYEPPYCTEAISSCNKTGRWDIYDPIVEAGCTAYTASFTANDKIYRNIFCYLCNSQYNANSNDGKACYSNKETDPYPYPSFAALLDFRPRQLQATVMVKEEENSNCTSGFVYDHYQEECLNIVCPAMTVLRGENCEMILHSVGGLCLDAYIKIDPFEPVYGDVLDKAIYFFITDHLRSCALGNLQISIYYQPGCVSAITCVRDGQMERDYFVLYVTTRDFKCVDELVYLDDRNIVLTGKGDSGSFNSTFQVYDVLSELVEKSGADEGTSIDAMLMPVPGLDSEHLCLVKWKRMILTKFLTCPAINLKLQDVSIFQENGSLYIADISLSLPHKDFFVDRNGLLVCIDDYIPATRSFKSKKTQKQQAHTVVQANIIGFTTLACVCCSLISLSITIAVYIFLPSLRTQPGINNIFLSLSLLLALITFQFGAGRTENSTICTAIGITVHFLWLNNIFWMNICCYHMFRTFSDLKLPKLNNACTKTTLKYALYSVLLSLVFVVINVVYALGSAKNGTIGYGKRANICYIQPPLMVALTMTLPTFMVVLCNFVMYIKVVCSIKRTRANSTLAKKHNRSFITYMKLSTLTGLAWLSYIPVYLTDLKVFEGIFAALVTCQGVFIMIAFVCNKRFYQAFKDRINGRVSRNSSLKYIRNSSKDTKLSTIEKA